MTQIENAPNLAATLDEVQQGWHELTTRVGQLEAERNLLDVFGEIHGDLPVGAARSWREEREEEVC